jgi:hypothetical protein
VSRTRRRNRLLRDELKRSEDASLAANSKLVTTKEVVAWSAQALADSLGRSNVLEEELGQLRSMAWSLITEVLGPHPRSSALTANLSRIRGKVTGHVTDRVFHGASGVLMSLKRNLVSFGAWCSC